MTNAARSDELRAFERYASYCRGLRETVLTLTDMLADKGVRLPDALKARDRKEPGRTEKEKAEDRLYAIIRRHFKRQADLIDEHLQIYHPDRKTVLDTTWLDDDLLWDDPDFEAALVLLLTQTAKDGIGLFQETVTLGIDYTLTNVEAAKWAREYAGELIKGINQTTKEAVRQAVGMFADTPGMTIRNVMDLLPFNEQRALTVATTEITRSYAQGNQLAGEAMREQFPDVRVTKRWFTNNDDRVCEICGPLDGKEVDIDEVFAPGIDNPPAHVNCRCWTSTGTRING